MFLGAGSYFPYSPLPKPHVSPQITREGESVFFPEVKYVVSALTSSSSQLPMGEPVNWLLTQNLWSLGRCHRLRDLDCPLFRSQPCGLESLMLLTKWLKMRVSMTPPPRTIISRTGDWSRENSYCSQSMYRIKLRKNEIEEICRAKGSGDMQSLHALVRWAPSYNLLLLPSRMLSECQYSGFLMRFH